MEWTWSDEHASERRGPAAPPPVNVLTVNPGSSSLKLAVLDADDRLVADDVEAKPAPGSTEALRSFLAAAHRRRGCSRPARPRRQRRARHGDGRRRCSAPVSTASRDLAPLHNPVALDAIDALRELLPGTPIVVCVDTAFHTTIPDAAATYAVPWEWTTRHASASSASTGSATRYASRRAAEILGEAAPESLRLVTCHLGSGASLAAIADGVSVDTTMGFTPLDGLVMATRAGRRRPRSRRVGATPRRLDGRRGRASARPRERPARRSRADRPTSASYVCRGRPATTLAPRARRHGAPADHADRRDGGAAGGLDALVFTGGVGEGSARVRRAAADRLAFLGVELGPANESDPPPVDTDVSAPDATARTLVVHASEDIEMAREARTLVG